MRFLVSLVFLIMLGSVAVASANSLPGLNGAMTYHEVKTWHQQFLAGNPTVAERVNTMRSIVSISDYRQRGLNRIFGNFEGRHSLDPRIPGVEDSVLKVKSSSRSQAKGYVRELLYAKAIHNDPRFQLISMNEILKRPWGNTDADIRFRYGKHGLFGRIEVKDVSPSSQSSNIKKLKRQIDKMAREYRHTGQPQIWANRRETIPSIKAYARNQGILVFEKVSTGQISRTKGMPSAEFLNEVASQTEKQQGTRAVQGGAQLGFGLWVLRDTAPAARSDLQMLLDSNTRSNEAWRRFGEHGSLFAAGGAMSVSGAARLGNQYANQAWQARLFRFGRLGGTASMLALASGEAFMISRYLADDISSRAFWTSQWTLVGSAAGGYCGSLAGGALGSLTWTPFGTTAGALLGSIPGSWAGGKVSVYGADSYYDWKFSALDQRFAEFVYESYEIH